MSSHETASSIVAPTDGHTGVSVDGPSYPTWMRDLIASEIGDALSVESVRPVSAENIASRADVCAQYIFARLTAAIPTDNDGKEQDAFEAWAEKEQYDMSQHPLHWLFLDRRTYAARNGWRGALAYVKQSAGLPTHPLRRDPVSHTAGETEPASDTDADVISTHTSHAEPAP